MLTHPPAGSSTLRSPAVILAAACMASAGIIHAAAAGVHNEHYALATLFAITAVVQLGWAAFVLHRPSRLLLVAGALLAFGAVAFWAVTKVWGIGFVEGLSGSQPADFQDSVATMLELIAGCAALRAVWHPAVNGRRTMLVSRVAIVLGALALVAAVPASAAPHDGDHDHGEVADGEGHGDHGDGDGASVTVAGYTFEHAGITDEQRDAAEQFVVDTRRALAETPYWDYEAAIAAGYYSIGDQVTGHEHLINGEYLGNDNVVDPNEIESLVYEVADNGTKKLVSAMYLMPPGSVMGEQPDIGGEVTKWHDHQNLCWGENGRVSGILINGKCVPGGTFRPTPPMLHVWVTEHECGPFAGIEGGNLPGGVGGHGEGCDHSEH